MQQNFDYVIVGGGSSGCVIAEHLSRDPRVSVCLIEAGPPDSSPLIHAPLGVAGLVGSSKYNWCFNTEPVPHMNQRRLFWPRGKTLGGSSSINAMVYIRGHADDYNDWADTVGDSRWSYRSLLPIFKLQENNERGPDEFHGHGGGLNVADLRDPNPLSFTYVEAGKQIGIPENRDFNGKNQYGIGLHQLTQRGGKRWSSARAFLEKALERPNLSVMTGRRVLRVTLENQRATGVEVRDVKRGSQYIVTAHAEVVLCGGAINSPQILMLSGIGPPKELEKHGIPVKHALAGVGQNLQDHLDITVMIKDNSKTGIGLALSFVPKAIVGFFRYLFFGRGFMTSNVAEGGGFAKISPESKRPEIQFHFLPTYLSDHGRKLVPGYGCTLHVCQLRPKSRGFIGLHSADPLIDPLIQPNYLDNPDDMLEMIAGVKLARRLLSAPAFKKIHGGEVEPGPGVLSDADIAADIRKRGESIYHPVGSCKMGNDALAVVDTHLRVHGIAGLRVADASIMPTLIGGNTNAPAMVIGEVAARSIVADRIAASSGDTRLGGRPSNTSSKALEAA